MLVKAVILGMVNDLQGRCWLSVGVLTLERQPAWDAGLQGLLDRAAVGRQAGNNMVAGPGRRLALSRHARCG